MKLDSNCETCRDIVKPLAISLSMSVTCRQVMINGEKSVYCESDRGFER